MTNQSREYNIVKLWPNSFFTSDWFYFVTFIMSYECYKPKPVQNELGHYFISVTI